MKQKAETAPKEMKRDQKRSLSPPRLLQAFVLLSTQPQLMRTSDPRGLLPLHTSARRGHLQLTQLLLDLTADVDALGLLDGRSALHCAAYAGDAERLFST